MRKPGPKPRRYPYMENTMERDTVDVVVENHFSLYLVRPLTEEAEGWIEDNVGEHQSFGGAVVVEPRYVNDIVTGMLSDGLRVVH